MAPVSYAADFTVQSGQTVGGQTLSTPGQTGTIEPAGTINAGGDGVGDVNAVNDLAVTNEGTIIAGQHGINIDGDAATIINDGTITAGDNGLEIDDDNVITNTGTINASDTGILGDSRNVITNSGTILGGPTDNLSDDGIHVSDNNTIINTGTIQGGDEGVEMDNNNVVINSGLIEGKAGEAIEADDDNRIENSGTIQNTGDDDFGRIVDRNVVVNSGLITSGSGAAAGDGIDGGDDNTVINTGTIRGRNNSRGHGIDFNDDAVIVNSGVIEGGTGVETGARGAITNSGIIRSTNGPAGTAINFLKNDADTLTVSGDFRIVGQINFRGGTDTINYLPGVSSVLTFNTGGLPEIINTRGQPFVAVGNQISVIDPTSFGLADEMLVDLTSGIFNAVHARLAERGLSGSSGFSGSALVGSSPMGLGARMNLLSDGSPPAAESQDKSSGMWAQALGGHREEDANGVNLSATHRYVGGISGLDGWISPTIQIGAFAGGAQGYLETEFDSQNIDVDSFFGGVYANFTNGSSFLRVLLTAGTSDHKSTRSVVNNTVSGGRQFAKASFDGDFVSPELAVGTTLGVGW